jgi:4-hydroxy-2-oxoheptanedioate aldolase
MPSISSLPERLRAASPAFTAWCGISEPAIPGILAHEAFDAVTIDMQHGAVDFAATVRAIPLVAAAGKPAIVRIPVGDFAIASRVLDAGASAVIAPMVNTVEDARRFAASMKYPPVGERSWGPHAAVTLSGLAPDAYFAQANGFSLAFAMVETREALAIVDEILAVPGIDGIFIGPSDLSIALTGGARIDPDGPEVADALGHALKRARAAGKFTAVYAMTGERAAAMADLGIDLIAVGGDMNLLRAGARAALAAARSRIEAASV